MQHPLVRHCPAPACPLVQSGDLGGLMTPGVLLLGGLGGGRPQQLPFLVMGVTSLAAVAVAATVRGGAGRWEKGRGPFRAGSGKLLAMVLPMCIPLRSSAVLIAVPCLLLGWRRRACRGP